MAAIAGQPGTKPSQLDKPVPGMEQDAEVQAYLSKYHPTEVSSPATNSAAAAPATNDLSQDPEIADYISKFGSKPAADTAGEKRPWYDISGKGLVEGAIDTIPAVGGIAGGIIGSGAGPLGTVGGAAVGGIAGASLKSFLQSALLDKNPESRKAFYGGLAKEGASQAAGAAVGEMIPVVAQYGKEAIKKAGTALGIPEHATGTYMDAPEAVQTLAAEHNGDVVSAANAKRSEFQQAIQAKKGELEDPVLQLMQAKGTTVSDAEAGDAVKALVKNNVETKYGPFKEAYAQLDAVNKVIPLRDEARVGFSQKLKNWAVEEFPQNSAFYNDVKRYADSFDASNNGLQFSNVMKELNGEIRAVKNTGNTDKMQVLLNIKNRANEFMDGQLTGFAKRVMDNTMSSQEAAAIRKMAEFNAGGALDQYAGAGDYEKFAKDAAKQFLDSQSLVKKDYSGFKSFMNNLEGATKVNSKGTLDFLNNLDEIPSEKLVSRMFDEKNSGALKMMKKEMPEVFDVLAKNKVKELMTDSMTKEGLNVVKFYDNVNSLPKEVKSLLFTPEDLTTMGKTVFHPEYVKLNRLLDEVPKNLLTPDTNPSPLLAVGGKSTKNAFHLNQLKELSNITGKNMVQDAQLLSAMEHYGKSKLSREQLFKVLLDVRPDMKPVVDNILLRQPTGQMIEGGAEKVYKKGRELVKGKQ